MLADICGTMAREGGTINNCVTEAELGSISRGGLPSMAAERADGGWRVTGRKIFVTGAPVLRFLATAVVLPPSEDAPQGELVSAIVEGRLAGTVAGRYLERCAGPARLRQLRSELRRACSCRMRASSSG